VNTEGKFVDICTLATEVEDTDLRVGYTTVESRLGIRLKKSVRFFGLKGHFLDVETSTKCDLDAMLPSSPFSEDF
jgi:hypothetical protein